NIETGETPHALEIFRIVRHRKSHEVEDSQAFTVVHPVGLSAELLVIHSAETRWNLSGLRFAVLAEHSFEALEVKPQNFVASSKRVKCRPAGKVFESIVRSVVGSPAQDALDVTAIVVILVVELLHRR